MRVCNHISDQQRGFLSGRSTTGAILSAVHDWYNINLDGGAEVQAVFFDLQKAFDTVPHAKLISKLSNPDIPSHLLTWSPGHLDLQLFVQQEAASWWLWCQFYPC